MTFNPHGSVTADGVLITPGLRVITNNLDHGKITEDRDSTRCDCPPDHRAAQKPVSGAWFTDHRAGDACPACRHNHWFTVTLDGGGSAMMDGERMATRFRGVQA